MLRIHPVSIQFIEGTLPELKFRGKGRQHIGQLGTRKVSRNKLSDCIISKYMRNSQYLNLVQRYNLFSGY